MKTPLGTSDTGTVVIVPEGLESSEEHCLGCVRWVPRSMMQAADFKLQQLFSITTFRGGRAVTNHQEWRDVPHAHE